jgi:hypothetical protein
MFNCYNYNGYSEHKITESTKKKAPQKLVGWSRYMEGWQAGIGHFLRVKVLPGSDVRGKDKKNQELTKSGHF